MNKEDFKKEEWHMWLLWVIILVVNIIEVIVIRRVYIKIYDKNGNESSADDICKIIIAIFVIGVVFLWFFVEMPLEDIFNIVRWGIGLLFGALILPIDDGPR